MPDAHRDDSAAVGGTGDAAPGALDPARLGERLRNGDPDAVRDLYRAYSGAVLTVARAYVADRATADDVVQQTFVNAWRGAGSLRAGGQLSPWLYQIARRCAIDALRRRARTPDPAGLTGSAGGEGAGAPGLADGAGAPVGAAAHAAPTFEQTWEAFEVRRALDALPDVEREVVRLAQLAGLTHPEIAERLGVPVGTVKSRLGRAYRRLELSLVHLAPAADAAAPLIAGSAAGPTDAGPAIDPTGATDPDGATGATDPVDAAPAIDPTGATDPVDAAPATDPTGAALGAEPGGAPDPHRGAEADGALGANRPTPAHVLEGEA